MDIETWANSSKRKVSIMTKKIVVDMVEGRVVINEVDAIEEVVIEGQLSHAVSVREFIKKEARRNKAEHNGGAPMTKKKNPSRNGLCFCGTGKKYKKCCGKG